MSKCEICGYVIETPKELEKEQLYGCARSLLTNNSLGNQILQCSYDSQGGIYRAPGTDPNQQIEDPDALKENFVKKYEKNKKPNGKDNDSPKI